MTEGDAAGGQLWWKRLIMLFLIVGILFLMFVLILIEATFYYGYTFEGDVAWCSVSVSDVVSCDWASAVSDPWALWPVITDSIG